MAGLVHSARRGAWNALLLLLPVLGCSGGDDDAATASAARERARATWTLAIDDAGATSQAPLEVMDVFLDENESASEWFLIRGTGVTLAGEIPAASRVGYGEEFEKLVGAPLPILPEGGDPREPSRSSVTLNGMAVPVTGGTLTVERVTGKWSGSEGDRTLHGRIELRVPGADGDRTVHGRIAVNIVTWG